MSQWRIAINSHGRTVNKKHTAGTEPSSRIFGHVAPKNSNIVIFELHVPARFYVTIYITMWDWLLGTISLKEVITRLRNILHVSGSFPMNFIQLFPAYILNPHLSYPFFNLIINILLSHSIPYPMLSSFRTEVISPMYLSSVSLDSDRWRYSCLCASSCATAIQDIECTCSSICEMLSTHTTKYE